MKLISLDLPKFIWICDFLFFNMSMCFNNLFFNIFFFFFFFLKIKEDDMEADEIG